MRYNPKATNHRVLDLDHIKGYGVFGSCTRYAAAVGEKKRGERRDGEDREGGGQQGGGGEGAGGTNAAGNSELQFHKTLTFIVDSN